MNPTRNATKKRWLPLPNVACPSLICWKHPSWLKAGCGISAGDELDQLLNRFGIEPEPVTTEQLAAARRAWRRFGRGNHPAGLNFGDCFAYALAETTGEPLLFKGADFALTDVAAAVAEDGAGGP